MTEKEKEIRGFMERHGLTRAEAELLWEQDNSDYLSDEMKEIEEKNKKMRRYVKSDKERKKSTRERKVDNEKKFLLEIVADSLEKSNISITERKTETELKFSYNSNDYTLKLTKHRPPKK